MREIVLDTETTGLDPSRGDRVVEIACVELANHMPTGRTYQQYINPERDMPAEAFAVHGLSEEFLSGHPVFADVVEAFCEFIDGGTLIIHNAPFDTKFLNHELGCVDRPPIESDLVVDSLEIARRKHPFGPNSLDALCRRYAIDNSARTLHGALLDCELLAEVYLELIGGRQPEFGLDTGAGSGPAGRKSGKPRPVRSEPLASRLTAEEIAAHEAFVRELGPDAVWHRYGVGRPIKDAKTQ